MLPDQSFFVKAGDLLKASTWNAAGRAIRSLTLFSGAGIRLRTTANGTIINIDTTPQSFVGFFRVALQGVKTCTVGWGQIDGMDGTIGTDNESLLVPPGGVVPTLDLQRLVLDSTGRGYIAAEITCKPDWSLDSWKIVQVADFTSDDGKASGKGGVATSSLQGGIPGISGRRARQPLAMLLQDQVTKQLSVFQITYFSLQHRVNSDVLADGSNVRHFFAPQG